MRMDSGLAPSGAPRNDEEKKPSAINKLPDGQNISDYTKLMSSLEIKNISLFPKAKSGAYLSPSRPAERGVGHRRERWTGCGGRGGADDERYQRVRRSRVVPTPRCWRQVGGSSPADDGGKKADHRGEHAISRKAIAQGMPDALRCPVCSCAHFLVTLHT